MIIEDMIYKGLEGKWRISEAKGHNYEFKMTMVGG